MVLYGVVRLAANVPPACQSRNRPILNYEASALKRPLQAQHGQRGGLVNALLLLLLGFAETAGGTPWPMGFWNGLLLG